MTSPDLPALASQIEAAVRNIPGVTALFSPQSSLHGLISPARITTHQTDAGLTVVAAIGVQASHSAAEIARHAHEVMRRMVTEHGHRAQVQVTVVHVDAS